MNQEASKEMGAGIGTRLAHERTDVAMTRTRMAAERTLMAWIRTALSMISFGFTILKFFEFIQDSQERLGMFKPQRAEHLGMVLISLGTLILLPAIFQHRRLMKTLSSRDGKSQWSLSLIVAIAVGGFGILAFMSGIFRWLF